MTEAAGEVPAGAGSGAVLRGSDTVTEAGAGSGVIAIVCSDTDVAVDGGAAGFLAAAALLAIKLLLDSYSSKLGLFTIYTKSLYWSCH